MLAGDIILFNYDKLMTGKWKILNWFVKKFDGNINHVALYYSDDYVIEAWDGKGVRKRKIQAYEDFEAMRLINVKFDVIINLERYYSDTKGMKYSWRDWANAAIYKVFKIKLFKNDNSGFICSEYVSEFYKRCYQLDLCEEDFETPNDFLKSKYLEKI